MNTATLGLPRRLGIHANATRSLDLEDDIESISKLDVLRRKAARLRKDGLASLGNIDDPEGWIRPVPKRTTREKDAHRAESYKKAPLWSYEGDEPADFIGPALAVLVATRHFGWEYCRDTKGSLKPYWAAAALRLQEYSLQAFHSGSEVPVLEAARVLHALMSCPELSLKEATVYAYYRVIEELQSVDSGQSNFIVGAARAHNDSHPSAFVTAECLRAVHAFARGIKRTAEFLEAMAGFFGDCKNLLQNFSVPTDKTLPQLSYPNEWANAELRRVSLHYFTTFSRLARHSMILIAPETLGSLLEPGGVKASDTEMPQNITQFITKVIEDFEKCQSSLRPMESAIRKINKQMQRDGKIWLKEIISPAGRGGKQIAAAQSLIKQLVRLKGAAYDSQSQEWSDASESFRKLATALKQSAARVEEHFEPAKRYLETVLNHEVVKRSGQTLRSGELACAAAAFAIMERGREIPDRRLKRAAQLLQKYIGPDGSFETATHLRTGADGAHMLTLLGSEVLRAFAQLLENIPLDVRPSVIECMLRYFEAHIVRDSGKPSFAAWTTDRPSTPRRAYRWTTALAVMSLERIVRMLDEQINQRIFRHFTVRAAHQLDDGIRLESLIYPDYGLAMLAKNDTVDGICPNEMNGESIAYFLERARAHIEGIPKHRDAYDKRCYSLLLYGPPGTGKTTFLEALAKTTNRHLVEVTPSDIIVEGESQVERRARIVFKALSMINRAVILFDEFDPVLKDRTGDENRQPSVFSFVTPGMLPKLKELNRAAKDQQVVFALATNRIGTLDEAAIRSGRFDFKVGVFPPDAISRAGAIAKAILDADKSLDKSSGAALADTCDIARRAAKLVIQTAGLGMTLLGGEGNLRPLKGKSWAPSDFDENTILYRAFAQPDGDFLTDPPDANPDRRRNGVGEYLNFEDRQWIWIILMDRCLRQSDKAFPIVDTDSSWVQMCKQMRGHASSVSRESLDKAEDMVRWRNERTSLTTSSTP